MAITMFYPEKQQQAQQAPQAPGQVTTQQDQARQRLLAGLQGPAPAADDRWANAQHAVNTGINYWAGLDGMKQAKAADQAQTAQQQANQQNLAGLLMGGSGRAYR